MAGGKKVKSKQHREAGGAGRNSQHTAAETAAASPDAWTPQFSPGSGLPTPPWTGGGQQTHAQSAAQRTGPPPPAPPAGLGGDGRPAGPVVDARAARSSSLKPQSMLVGTQAPAGHPTAHTPQRKPDPALQPEVRLEAQTYRGARPSSLHQPLSRDLRSTCCVPDHTDTAGRWGQAQG